MCTVERRNAVGDRRKNKRDRRKNNYKYGLFNDLFWMNAKVFGLALGLLSGLGLFIATNWLVIKGGQPIGPNLQLLSQFFIGYQVSFLGSLVGFGYGFALGTLSGASIGWIYNKIVAFRNKPL